MPSIADLLKDIGTIVALIAGIAALLNGKHLASKTKAEAAQIITAAAAEMVEHMQASLALVEAELTEKKRLIDTLEVKVSTLEIEMAEVKRERSHLLKRQKELERGVRILIEQIRCLGHEPKYVLDEE